MKDMAFRRFTVVAAVFVTALAIPTLASAQAVNSVYACIHNGNVRIVAVAVGSAPPAGTCKPEETLISWAIVGPTGAPGTPGVAGTPGAPGMTGGAGTPGTSVTFGGNFAGNMNGCPNGGATYLLGTVPTYVCNGIAAARAAGPCFDNTNRYVDCGNGTVTDTLTGLIWLKNAACLGSLNWASANATAAALANGQCGLADGSSPGDWRLATTAEWQATTARAYVLSCVGPSGPALTDDAGTACMGSSSGAGSSFSGVVTDGYWSSTTVEDFPETARIPLLGLGGFNSGISSDYKSASVRVWPVRSGR